MTNKSFLIFGLMAAAFSVVLGAFAAHGLKASLTAYQLGVFETAVRYQMYHGLAIILTVLLQIVLKTTVKASLWLFSAGILCFSGSLYLLVLTGEKWLGPITPLGGFCFILGWLWLAINIAKTPFNAEQ